MENKTDDLLHYICPSTQRLYQVVWKSFQAFLRESEDSLVNESVFWVFLSSLSVHCKSLCMWDLTLIFLALFVVWDHFFSWNFQLLHLSLHGSFQRSLICYTLLLLWGLWFPNVLFWKLFLIALGSWRRVSEFLVMPRHRSTMNSEDHILWVQINPNPMFLAKERMLGLELNLFLYGPGKFLL